MNPQVRKLLLLWKRALLRSFQTIIVLGTALIVLSVAVWGYRTSRSASARPPAWCGAMGPDYRLTCGPCLIRGSEIRNDVIFFQ